tara:strand:- start:95 stop:553 length:459 start_codon:yes stop_codon:yes gene_type:complete
MRIVIQRVSKAKITIENKEQMAMGEGLVVLLGITHSDCIEDANWLVKKVVNLRIFNDEKGVMNRSIKDIKGAILVVSQFTLMASTKKGNRPTYLGAAKHEHAIPLYEFFLKMTSSALKKEILSGKFGADMQIDLINDGPVTIIIDSKNKEQF